MDSEKYKLHQTLLDQEIFQGVVCGLVAIFSEKQEDNGDIIDSYKEDETTTTTTTAEPEDINPEKTMPDPETTTKFPSTITSTTNTILKNYDNGGINLAKMVCLMLVSALAPVFGSEGCKEKILPIVESMVTDPMFYVRKEAAAAVGSLSTVLAPDVTLERLVSIYFLETHN